MACIIKPNTLQKPIISAVLLSSNEKREMKYGLIIIQMITLLFRQLGLKNIPSHFLNLLEIEFHTRFGMIKQHYLFQFSPKRSQICLKNHSWVNLEFLTQTQAPPTW